MSSQQRWVLYNCMLSESSAFLLLRNTILNSSSLRSIFNMMPVLQHPYFHTVKAFFLKTHSVEQISQLYCKIPKLFLYYCANVPRKPFEGQRIKLILGMLLETVNNIHLLQQMENLNDELCFISTMLTRKYWLGEESQELYVSNLRVSSWVSGGNLHFPQNTMNIQGQQITD